MTMTYGSVCSGIEAATVAWEPLGWRPKFFAEIEKFPSAVLAERFGSNMPGAPLPGAGGVPNLGDFTKIGPEWGPVDILVGGTPCQSFSVAGRRLGLDDPRGNLALEFLALARRLSARWIVWENVPGVLSSASGACEPDGAGGVECGGSSDFATFLGFVRECGYSGAWRVLDAQYIRTQSFPFAVPQRRRRVFLVGHLGSWRGPASVFLDPESLRRDPPPRRQAGQGAAGTVGASASRCSGDVDDARDGRLIASERDVSGTVSSKWAKGGGGPAVDEVQNLVAHALRAEGFDASEDGTGRGVPIVPVMAFPAKDNGADASDGVSPTSRAGSHAASHANAGIMPAIAFDLRGREGGAMPEGPHDTANIRAHSGGSSRSYVAQGGTQWVVRRLTPRECERLQGFPDDHTLIPWRGKPAAECPDGPRYKALGNSMAVNVMGHVGARIALYERLRAKGLVP